MSRIDSVELALRRATHFGHDTKGAVAASDAFFPFPDSIETLANAGVTCIVAPSGAKRDDESVAAANRLGVSLLFAPDRHFRH
jgi:phosphoribosylaminoimidazolecarboxamide formyltransferase/IMP cyclohydrolase